MSDLIHVAILDDHQSIIDGYLYRLAKDPGIEVVATMHYGEELESVLAQHTIDALLLDIQVPTSEANTNPYPILYLIPKLVHVYPKLNILVISMHNQNSLIRAVMDAGASGYILKDDQSAIKTLPSLIRTVTGGGIYLSQHIYQQLRKREKDPSSPTLTVRQLEALSLCAAYPNASTADLARIMNIEGSTIRNLLSNIYIKLQVNTRAAAIAKARQMSLIAAETPPFDFEQTLPQA